MPCEKVCAFRSHLAHVLALLGGCRLRAPQRLEPPAGAAVTNASRARHNLCRRARWRHTVAAVYKMRVQLPGLS